MVLIKYIKLSVIHHSEFDVAIKRTQIVNTLKILTFFDITPRERIASKTGQATTYWVMVNYLTLCVDTTHSGARVLTFLI